MFDTEAPGIIDTDTGAVTRIDDRTARAVHTDHHVCICKTSILVIEVEVTRKHTLTLKQQTIAWLEGHSVSLCDCLPRLLLRRAFISIATGGTHEVRRGSSSHRTGNRHCQ